MTAAETSAPHQRVRGRPFRKGVSGNPAGRPPGSRQTVASMLARTGGVSPLEFLLATYQDTERAFATRMRAAIAALPYCHAVVSASEAPELQERELSAADVEIERRHDAQMAALCERLGVS